MNVASFALIYLGLTTMVIGSFGIARLPDLYSRLQASGAADTVGAIIALAGFLLHGGLEFSDAFLGILILFLFVTGPIVTHSIAKAAFLSEVKPLSDRKSRDE
ncbi:MAG: monovalent cation/H(+) antiporter subunit G [Candidatus Acetothermia bacterium]